MIMKKFIGANWKMNSAPSGCDAPDSPFRSTDDVDIAVFPSSIDIPSCVNAGLNVGGQYGKAEASGSWTGDISMKQLIAAGCRLVLCGHSERRTHYSETDEEIAKQVVSALKEGLTAILCIGETKDEKEQGIVHDVLKRQLTTALSAATVTSENFIVAYEPVWAIGTGKTPEPADVQNTHAFIRSLLPGKAIRILYGGSVNATNTSSFLSLKDIDGALVGGASLKPQEFRKIIEATTAK